MAVNALTLTVSGLNAIWLAFWTKGADVKLHFSNSPGKIEAPVQYGTVRSSLFRIWPDSNHILDFNLFSSRNFNMRSSSTISWYDLLTWLIHDCSQIWHISNLMETGSKNGFKIISKVYALTKRSKVPTVEFWRCVAPHIWNYVKDQINCFWVIQTYI